MKLLRKLLCKLLGHKLDIKSSSITSYFETTHYACRRCPQEIESVIIGPITWEEI